MNVIKRNNITILGRGAQTLIFSHGFGCDQNVWRDVAPWFLDKYSVILFDHVGSGRSDLTAYDAARYSSLRGYASDILEICQELGLHDVIFVGHSVGAMIGMLSAIEKPGYFSKLILIGPSPCYSNEEGYIGGAERADLQSILDFMNKDYHEWAYTFSAFVMGNVDHPSLGVELAESFCNTNSAIARQFASVTFLSDNRADLPRLQTKCLILQCAEDMIAPEEVGDYVHSRLQDATLVRLKATGHCPHMSAPLETIQAIEAFLAREEYNNTPLSVAVG